MKKIFIILSILITANCASDLPYLRTPNIKGSSNKSVNIYFDKELKTKYIVGGKIESSSFNILDVANSKKKLGTSSQTADWSQNIGELSMRQFKHAFSKAFATSKIVDSKIFDAEYLIIPTITNHSIEINQYSRSVITISYKIEVYDTSKKLVYSDEQTFKSKGKRKSFGVASANGIPIMADSQKSVNDSSMIFEVVSDGVDKMVNTLISSQFIKNN